MVVGGFMFNKVLSAQIILTVLVSFYSFHEAEAQCLVAKVTKNGAVKLTQKALNKKGKCGRKGFDLALLTTTGPKGDTGNEGDLGDAGDEGDDGLSGLIGPKGETGSQGIQGIQGAQGVQGLQGTKGDKGDKGDVGAVGPVGAVGAQGPSGTNSILALTDTSVGADLAYKGEQKIVPTPQGNLVTPADALQYFTDLMTIEKKDNDSVLLVRFNAEADIHDKDQRTSHCQFQLRIDGKDMNGNEAISLTFNPNLPGSIGKATPEDFSFDENVGIHTDFSRTLDVVFRDLTAGTHTLELWAMSKRIKDICIIKGNSNITVEEIKIP